MTMRDVSLALVLASASALSFGADAPSPAQISLLASSCANCHGTDGQGTETLPSLAGRSAAVLETQLLGFKHDEPSRATVMDRIARGYSDTELKALAAYFAGKQSD